MEQPKRRTVIEEWNGLTIYSDGSYRIRQYDGYDESGWFA